MFRKLNLTVLWVICLVIGGQALAQVRSSTIAGTVTDGAGALVPEAAVTVTNQDTNTAVETKTNAAGEFTVPYLQAGKYSLLVQREGFQPHRRTEIGLGSAQAVRIDVTLELSSIQSVVEVRAETVQLQTENSTVQGAVDKTVIANIPNVTHNPLLYAALQAGVTPHSGMLDTTSSNAFGVGYWSKFQYSGLSINGGNAFTNDIQLDGLSVQGSAWNEASVMPNPDAIEEVRVSTNNYAADLGRGQGVVSMITKSGTNQFHGGMTYTMRRDALNANTFQNNRYGNPKGDFTVDQLGGTFGGAIIKDKLFFFSSYEHLWHTAPAWWQLSVPTADERKGDFSKTLVADSTGAAVPAVIYDPYNVVKINDNVYRRMPYPDAKITNPNPYALKIYQAYAMPNRNPSDQYGANNFYTMKDQAYSRDSSNNRIDYHRGNHSIYGTGGLEQGSIHTPRVWGDDSPFYVVPSSGWTSEYNRDKDPYGAIGDTIVISPTLVVDVRYGISRISTDSVSGQNDHFDYSAWGVPAATQAILSFPGVALDIQPGGYSALGLQGSQQKRERQTNHSLAGSATKTVSRWTIKAGAEFRNDLSNYTDFQTGSAKLNGQPNYTAEYADAFGNSLGDRNILATQGGLNKANMLTGADTYIVPPGFNTRLALSQKLLAFYSQNDWRVTSKLTLNLGLRWELQPGPTERYNRISDIDFQATNPYYGTGKIVYPGSDGYSRNLWDTEWRDFQPRLGFAYRVTDSVVVRGGYGRSYVPTNTGYYDGPFSYGSTGFAAFNQARLYGTNPNGVPVGAFSDQNTTSYYAAPGAIQSPSIYGTAGYPFFDRHNTKNGRVDQWNFFIEKRFGGAWVASAGYVGSRGAHLQNARMPYQNIQNIGDATLASWEQTWEATGIAQNPANDLVPNPYLTSAGKYSGQLGNEMIPRWLTMMPYPVLGPDNTLHATNGFTNYNALQLHLSHNFSRGFTLQSHYTWSKALGFSDTDLQANQYQNDNSGQGGVDLRNLDNNKSLLPHDIKNRFLIVATYDLPFGPGKLLDVQNSVLRHVIGNWTLGGVYTVQSGFPFGSTDCGGSINKRCDVAPGQSPEVPENLQRWYDGKTQVTLPDGRTYTPCANCFLKYNPDYFQGRVFEYGDNKWANMQNWFGNAARTYDFLRGPGRNNLDLSITRQFKIREKFQGEFVANLTNAFNHTQFKGNSYNVQTWTNLGAATANGFKPGMNGNNNYGTHNMTTYDPRQVTFNFRVRF